MSALSDQAIENEIAAGLMPRATINIAYRQMLAVERVAAALEKVVAANTPRLSSATLDALAEKYKDGPPQDAL